MLGQFRSCVCELYLPVPVPLLLLWAFSLPCHWSSRKNLSLSRCKPKYWKLHRNTCNETQNTCSESEMPMAMTYLHKLCTRVTRLESPWESVTQSGDRALGCILTTITEMISDIQCRKHITLTPLPWNRAICYRQLRWRSSSIMAEGIQRYIHTYKG